MTGSQHPIGELVFTERHALFSGSRPRNPPNSQPSQLPAGLARRTFSGVGTEESFKDFSRVETALGSRWLFCRTQLSWFQGERSCGGTPYFWNAVGVWMQGPVEWGSRGDYWKACQCDSALTNFQV